MPIRLLQIKRPKTDQKENNIFTLPTFRAMVWWSAHLLLAHEVRGSNPGGG